MTTALLSLGSNLGDRQTLLEDAVGRLRALPGVAKVVVSSLHTTLPIGGPAAQSTFLNAAAKLETEFTASELLLQMQTIETELGRVRQQHWGPRTLDLDLLLYGEETISLPNLTVPHRFLPFRRFVLEPASEVAHEMLHPTFGLTIHQLKERLSLPPIFSISGPRTAELKAFAERIANHLSGKLHEAPQDAAPGEGAYRLTLKSSHGDALKGIFRLGAWATPPSAGIPWLELPPHDLELAVSEAIAAIEAMSP